ncbi:MAG TPA: hypothetical protein VFE31_09230 [Opitutaceae bacterium]|jgi:hypothetical protein|nr:hypothetical protein [Opitutaceae bacterium]
MNRQLHQPANCAGTSYTKASMRMGCGHKQPVAISRWNKQQTGTGFPA